jgi:hypothetical protein
VDEVRRIILTRFPYELTDLILTSAQYWARLATKRTIPLFIHASKEKLFNAKWLYMISDPVPEIYHGAGFVTTKVQYVRFGLRSCDQGWGGVSQEKSTIFVVVVFPFLMDCMSGLVDTYRNSYTWFEASIIRPTHHPSSPLPGWISDTVTQGPINLNNTTIITADDDECGITELTSPYSRQNKRWLVQMNVQASRHIKRHDVIWTRESEAEARFNGDPSEEDPAPEYNKETGSGRGKGFVQTLRAGDRISLVARALVSSAIRLVW